MSADELWATLQRVPYLAPVDEPTLRALADRGRRARYASGSCLVAELEAGADVFVLLSGQADVTVDARDGGRKKLHTLGPGDAFGEMSSLTGELRSATVTAVGDVEVLVIADADFDRLREQRPLVARALGANLAKRLRETEELLAQLLVTDDPAQVPRPALPTGRRGSIRRAFDELVVNRRQDLAVIALFSFVATLLIVRLTVYISFRLDFFQRDILRAAYLTGFMLLVGSAGASLLTFRPQLRRLIAVAYGIGVALIVNELGVTLAFDIFYKNIHTADPNTPFDIERLYRRTEGPRAIFIALLILIQAAYLRRFYGRVWFVARTRARRLFG